MKLITTIIGFGMSAAFIAFVCARIVCGRLRGAESRPRPEIDTRIDPVQQERQINGLEPVLVAAIPTMRYNHEAFSSIEDAQCSICLGEYQEREVLRIMPQCGHNFHVYCIDVWLRKQSTCPVCRFPLQHSLGPKHVRRATLGSSQSAYSPETSTEHSRQWLLPGSEGSPGNISGEVHLDVVPGNSSQPNPTESETR